MIIDDLKGEHKLLFRILDEVELLGVSNKPGQEKLMSAKSILLAHLAKEDEKLYPVLHKLAETNDTLEGLLEVFSEEMSEISQKAILFFDKYTGATSYNEFYKDFIILSDILRHRMENEETLLYPEFIG